MIRLTDLTRIGPALYEIREMLGISRREAARRIAEVTGRTETSVNAQVWEWDHNRREPGLSSLRFLLDVIEFDLALVPKADAFDDSFRFAVEAAIAELDQDHPWIPGGVFLRDPHLKPLLLSYLRTLAPPEVKIENTGGDTHGTAR